MRSFEQLVSRISLELVDRRRHRATGSFINRVTPLVLADVVSRLPSWALRYVVIDPEASRPLRLRIPRPLARLRGEP